MNWHSAFSNQWAITVGGGLAVAGLSAAFKAVRQFWRNVWTRIRSQSAVPNETLRIIQSQNAFASFWALGNSAGTPAMQVVFEGYITNISSRAIKVVGAEIPRPLTSATMLILMEDHDGRRSQILRPHECVEIHAMFFVEPIVGKPGTAWKTPLIFIDQYNNRHKVSGCTFRAIPPTPNPSHI